MRITILPLLLLLVTQSFSANGQIYKTTDEHGNTVFTDKLPDTRVSEPVILEPPTRLPSPINTTPSDHSSTTPELSEDITYSVFSISSPGNDSTVRNNGNFAIYLSIQPNLMRGHKVRFFIDGQQISGSQTSLSHQVENMSRGTHLLRAEVLNHSGKVIQKTESTVHVHRAIYRPPSP